MNKEKVEIVLASSNKGKLAEIATMLKPCNVLVRSLAEFPEIGNIEENGNSFEANALIKARHVAEKTGLPCLADDSGLVVDALDGAPGVFSARFANDIPYLPGESLDQRNTRKVLLLMADVPEADRACRFVTVMACVRPDGSELLTRGEWKGRLLFEPRGNNGFGYDPVFYDEELQKSAAEMSGTEKNARSHRGKALTAMIRQLPAFLGISVCDKAK